MSIKERIIKLWDENDYLLKEKCTNISVDEDYCDLLREMWEFVANPESKALWLALPQLGILKRGFVMRWLNWYIACVNPKVEVSWRMDKAWEECLSEPGVKKIVFRFQTITLKFYDLDWKYIRLILSWLLARIVLHEMDHLNWVLLSHK